MREAGARLGLALAALGQAGAEADGSAAVFAVLVRAIAESPVRGFGVVGDEYGVFAPYYRAELRPIV